MFGLNASPSPPAGTGCVPDVPKRRFVLLILNELNARTLGCRLLVLFTDCHGQLHGEFQGSEACLIQQANPAIRGVGGEGEELFNTLNKQENCLQI